MGAEGKGGGKWVGGVEGDGWVDGCGREPKKRKEEPNGRDTIGAFRSQRLAVYN